MKHVAAYLLAQLGGKDAPTKDDISKIIGAVGGECDGDKCDKFLAGPRARTSSTPPRRRAKMSCSAVAAAVAAAAGAGRRAAARRRRRAPAARRRS